MKTTKFLLILIVSFLCLTVARAVTLECQFEASKHIDGKGYYAHTQVVDTKGWTTDIGSYSYTWTIKNMDVTIYISRASGKATKTMKNPEEEYYYVQYGKCDLIEAGKTKF